MSFAVAALSGLPRKANEILTVIMAKKEKAPLYHTTEVLFEFLYDVQGTPVTRKFCLFC